MTIIETDSKNKHMGNQRFRIYLYRAGEIKKRHWDECFSLVMQGAAARDLERKFSHTVGDCATGKANDNIKV